MVKIGINYDKLVDLVCNDHNAINIDFESYTIYVENEHITYYFSLAEYDELVDIINMLLNKMYQLGIKVGVKETIRTIDRKLDDLEDEYE